HVAAWSPRFGCARARPADRGLFSRLRERPGGQFTEKVRFGATPKPARETRALPVPRWDASHHDSAIDAQHLASDVTGFCGREERHRTGDIFRRTGPSERNFSMNRVLDFVG